MSADGDTPVLRVSEDGIARLVFDDPERSQNVFDEGVLQTLAERIQEVRTGAKAGEVRALVVESAKPDAFIAGADLSLIEGIESPVEGERGARLGQAIFLEVEKLAIPTLAAIHGVCLGGGTELALACRYRLASDASVTEIALPEVRLGILPAWGGTTRLPRLVGLQNALPLLLAGKRISAEEARRIGLVEEVLPAGRFPEEVEAFVRARLEEGPVPTGADRSVVTRLLDDTPPGRTLVLSQARKRVEARTGGHYPAPLKILEVLRRSLGRSVERSFEIEAAAAGELLASEVSKNLLHVFRLREAARKGRGTDAEVEPRPVEALGVLGAGVMGGGIAQLAAYHEVRARMKDIRHEAVAGGLRHARELFEKAVRKGKLDRREADRKMELVSGGLAYEGFGSLDLVVEAVVEEMDVKRTVLREAEERVSPGCVLATNTSSLSLDAMAEALERPERFGGMHFFNPVHKMPLVEVVRGRKTSDETVATIYAFALSLGKVPVVVRKDGPGFLVNRILGPYLNEAGWLLAEGASVETVDEVAEEFGMPMGPLRLVDEVGVDVARHAGRSLHEALGQRLEPAPPLVAIADAGRLGRKGGRGFYRYEDGELQGVDPELHEVLGDSVPERPSRIEAPEVRSRLVVSMILEAARTLEEGIVDSAADVDLGLIMGTGFPPFRGGLLRFADRSHLRAVLDRARELEEGVGGRFRPPPLLEKLAAEGRGFYDAYP